MGLLDLLGLSRMPEGVEGATLVAGNAETLGTAALFLNALQSRFGKVALGVVGVAPVAGSRPMVPIPDGQAKAAALLGKIRPFRLIMLGLEGRHAHMVASAGCPVYWVNVADWEAAQSDCKVLMVADPQLQQTVPDSVLTGDPLLHLPELPQLMDNAAICERFKEQREGNRWIGYFAATGEGEEEEAYPIFNRLIRHKMGLMILAPHDQARCEPVYRESIKYQLQTIRHNRLSTSFVPIKTRVYYVEEPEPLAGLYNCVDFVVAGGTIHPHAHHLPDLIAPILNGKAVIIGPAQREIPLVRAAVAAKVVLAAANSEEIFEHARYLLENPAEGARLAGHALPWLKAQVGSLERVLALIE